MLLNLKILRNEMNISQQRLADALSISQQSINKYENHDVQPDLETLKKLASYFDTSVDYLIGYCDIRDKNEAVTEVIRNTQEADILRMYRKLSKKEKASVKALLKTLTE